MKEDVESIILEILIKFKCCDIDYSEALELIMAYIKENYNYSPVLPPFI